MINPQALTADAQAHTQCVVSTLYFKMLVMYVNHALKAHVLIP